MRKIRDLLYPLWFPFACIWSDITNLKNDIQVWLLIPAVIRAVLVILAFLGMLINPIAMLLWERLGAILILYLIGYAGYKITVAQANVIHNSQFWDQLGETIATTASGAIYGLSWPIILPLMLSFLHRL